MKKILLALIPTIASAGTLNPAPFPVFLKSGFSSILEFEKIPTRVVLGDGNNFHVEKLDHSLVIKTLVPYANTNMFVYFSDQDTKMFVLTASEDAEPTYFKRFETPKPPITQNVQNERRLVISKSSCRLVSSEFDAKKDFLIVNVEIAADSKQVIKPDWSLVRLKSGKATLAPMKLWSERKDVQRDSKVKARFIFARPNVPRNLSGVSVIVPVVGGNAFAISLKRGGA